ncbi:MAG: glycoside hydrolase family 15 protein [Planctomycetes bacterium]|nr:glycoside hydrolase family 15 protein [Planctomycetota bacterium]
MPARIEDYGLLGDCHSAALVSRDGSIDWLCWPRFDSPACFAALLGTPDHGRWRIAPEGAVRRSNRRYRDGTLVLETELETAEGVVALIDFMPPRADCPELVRIVEGRRGEVPMRMELIMRLDYGSVVPWVRRTEGGLRANAGPDTLHLFTDVDIHGEDFRTLAEFSVKAGERRTFQLVWSPTFGPSRPCADASGKLEETERWWRAWLRACSYEGPWRDAVLRSSLVLKALTYAPTGAIVAAPTTSLPEELGGVRNWDYRYCWLRDATFALYAFLVGGYVDEAAAWREWLANAVAGKPEQLHIMYGLEGERRLPELELPWLPGYEGSRPVRVGNAAHHQHQLDVYGEVMDALHVARRLGLATTEDSWRVQRVIVRFLERDWQRPDDGIWEVRGGPRHFTHSKVMAWVAADRAVKAVTEFGLPGDVERWRRLRDEIHAEVCARGFDPQLGAFVQHYGSKVPDASLLMLPAVGFLPATDPRMVGTVRLIEQRLVRDGFVDRYPTERGVDGLPGGEGAFLLCTFWLVDNLALQGRHDEALELFERLLSIRNDLGLLSEEYDPVARRLLGNFPQAFSHIGLINSARNLAEHGGPAEDRRDQDARAQRPLAAARRR